MKGSSRSKGHRNTVLFFSLLVLASVAMPCATCLAQEAAKTLGDISGEWVIVPVRDRAKTLTIDTSFDTTGALRQVIAPGFAGLIQGGASVDKDELLITVLDVYTFKGRLNRIGDEATGQLIYRDPLSGFQRRESARAIFVVGIE
jgi:hypothetical protein